MKQSRAMFVAEVTSYASITEVGAAMAISGGEQPALGEELRCLIRQPTRDLGVEKIGGLVHRRVGHDPVIITVIATIPLRLDSLKCVEKSHGLVC